MTEHTSKSKICGTGKPCFPCNVNYAKAYWSILSFICGAAFMISRVIWDLHGMLFETILVTIVSLGGFYIATRQITKEPKKAVE